MKKILIVDDNRHLASYLEKKLKEAGHEVHVALTGMSAINLLSDCIPDFVFIDYFLPSLNGDKLCQIIRKMKHLENAYLVIMSAAATELKLDLSTMGANAVIAKGTFQETTKYIYSVIADAEIPRGDEQKHEMLGFDAVYSRQMTIELLTKYRHLQAMLDSVSEGIIEIYCEQIVYANPTALTILGKSQDELLAAYLPCLFDESERPQVESVMKSGGNGNSAVDWKEPIKLGNRMILLRKLPFQGDTDTIIILITDITERICAEDALREEKNSLGKKVDEKTAYLLREINERKRAEEERRSLEERLQRSEKMEAMGKLAGGVAHDLNNVLGVVSGYSELLMERIPAGNPLREYAANILKSSEKAAAIIQDLLTLARRGVTITKVIHLNSIVSNLLTTLEFDSLQNYHKAVTFKTDLEKDLLNINGSPVHLEKTVMNLVSNAAEAIIGGGEVNIRTENRYLDKTIRHYDTVREGDYVVLTVSDTGVGIPAADLDKIFEPFYTKKKMDRSGTGLGLSIVWGTVKDHNGYINVQSTVGSGTTFTLYFPVTREKIGEAAQKIPLEHYMGHGESVLVVDDVEGQRNVATALLKQLGYQVHAVASGEEAVEYLKGNKADVMVLDMIMEPGIDGLETYQQIASFKPQQKAIIVSGFSETERVDEAKLLGAGAYVKKPYVMEKIGLAIRDELNRK